MATFTSLGLPPQCQERLETQGITQPAPVQAEAIPLLLAGKDVAIQAQTGGGKTLAYLLPMLTKLDAERPVIQGLVLAPTQELGIQIREVARALTAGTGLKVQALIGGANPARQIEGLKQGPQLIVGTPGRVLDLMRQQRVSLAEVRLAVVDEVDHLVEEGKQKDVESLLKALPAEAQRTMASATLGEQARAWVTRWLREPAEVTITPELRMPETLEHLALVADRRDKVVMVRRLLRHYEPAGAIAFVGQGMNIPELVAKLKYHQVNAAGLHGAVKKLERAAIMRDFRAGKIQLLVATDLAARGLDFGQVSLVMNYDLPTDAEHYVHRAGRTGRMGREGLVITLVDPGETWVIEKYEKALGVTFARPVFSHGEVRERTAIDEKREARQAAARTRKAKAAAEAGDGKQPKKTKERAPTARQVAKGKAKKAKKKASGTWKRGERKAE